MLGLGNLHGLPALMMVWYLWSVGSKHTAPVEIISVTVDSRGQNSFKINPPVGAETPMRTIMCSSPW